MNEKDIEVAHLRQCESLPRSEGIFIPHDRLANDLPLTIVAENVLMTDDGVIGRTPTDAYCWK